MEKCRTKASNEVFTRSVGSNDVVWTAMNFQINFNKQLKMAVLFLLWWPRKPYTGAHRLSQLRIQLPGQSCSARNQSRPVHLKWPNECVPASRHPVRSFPSYDLTSPVFKISLSLYFLKFSYVIVSSGLKRLYLKAKTRSCSKRLPFFDNFNQENKLNQHLSFWQFV